MRTRELTFEQRMRNVAAVVLEYTEIKRLYNGRGKPALYMGNVDAIAGAARQLAQMVNEYLDAGGVDHEEEPAGVVDDLPF